MNGRSSAIDGSTNFALGRTRHQGGCFPLVRLLGVRLALMGLQDLRYCMRVVLLLEQSDRRTRWGIHRCRRGAPVLGETGCRMLGSCQQTAQSQRHCTLEDPALGETGCRMLGGCQQTAQSQRHCTQEDPLLGQTDRRTAENIADVVLRPLLHFPQRYRWARRAQQWQGRERQERRIC